MKKGLTLIELLIAGIMLAALTGVGVYLFSAVLKTWSSQETRGGLGVDIDWRIENMVRDLREAKEIQSLAGRDEIRFSHDQATYYIYYLYNPNDGYPPAFNQDAYELRKAVLTGDINGTFTYGDGDFILRDIIPPPTSELSRNGDVLIVDFSITRKDETIRSRTQVKPRNLP